MDSALCNQTNSCMYISSVEWDMYPAAYSLFFIVGFPGNCLSLYVAWMLIKSGNNVAVYLTSLSISDLLYTITLPVWIEMALQRSVDENLCIVVNVIMHNSFYVGSGLLCCISVDRYLAVVYPLYFHCIREVRTAAAVSVAVWIVEIVIHISLLHHTGALQASRYLCKQKIPMTQEDANVALVRVVVGFLVPVLIMTFSFQQIMQSLSQSTSILAEERRKVGLLLLSLLLTYVASFLPYQAIMLLRATLEPENCLWAKRLRNAYLVTVAITTLNSTLDPIIYCLINESAKKEIIQAMEKLKAIFKNRKKCSEGRGVKTIS
ncbi:ovarian cancer G-protein coupled receptor 1-like [Parambassis ranga]|uniref:Ovarian cancer G-protein coupled receptor 1-like n=1 Tax=Parambassis ranga TaxID=210632 RepID=A0A6P7H928_9TELE|nr:ovarian cancer G-protein coupled receptor 1-like [Parambassis ranga]